MGISSGIGVWSAEEPKDFDWGHALEAGVALGTSLLAIFTGWLAWTTRSEVRATSRLAELTAEEQASRERPIVVASPIGFRLSDGGRKCHLSLELRNLGGPALDLQLRAAYQEPGLPGPILARSHPALASGELFPWALFIDAAAPAPIALPPFDPEVLEVEGDCTDRARRERYPVIVIPHCPVPE